MGDFCGCVRFSFAPDGAPSAARAVFTVGTVFENARSSQRAVFLPVLISNRGHDAGAPPPARPPVRAAFLRMSAFRASRVRARIVEPSASRARAPCSLRKPPTPCSCFMPWQVWVRRTRRRSARACPAAGVPPTAAVRGVRERGERRGRARQRLAALAVLVARWRPVRSCRTRRDARDEVRRTRWRRGTSACGVCAVETVPRRVVGRVCAPCCMRDAESRYSLSLDHTLFSIHS